MSLEILLINYYNNVVFKRFNFLINIERKVVLMNIAVVVAHPDDAEYLMGGTIIKYTKKGHKVSIITCTNGNVGHPTLSIKEIAKIRIREGEEGAKVMGAEVINLGYDDEFFPDNKESRLKLLNALREVEADVVFTHEPNDIVCADHRIVSNMAIDMSYLQMVKNIETKNIETKKYAALYFIDAEACVGFEPTDYVDITEVFELKKEALLKHKSQAAWMTRLGATDDFTRNMEIRAALRGMQYQCKYAEAFIFVNKYPRAVHGNLLPDYL